MDGHRAHVAAVSAIEPVGDAQERSQAPDHGALVGREHREHLVAILGRRAAVVAGDGGDQLALAVGEAGEIGVVDEVVAVLVVPVVADEGADVVQQRRGLQERALLVAEPVHLAGLIEERERQPRHLLGVLLAVADAAPERAQPLEDRVLVVLVGARRADPAAHQIGHQAVAQTAGGDLQLVDAQRPHHPFADGRAAIDDVGPVLLDAPLAPLLEQLPRSASSTARTSA